MGAEQSSTRNSQQDSNPPKTCYYELLDVGRQATDEDIKKAYRKKALELHPDRNYGNVESATIRFAEVQSAYQVLSDPQERAWYDAHRDSILQGEGGPAANDQFEHDAHLTSARDIVGLMSRFNSRTPFTDGPDGFFGILQDTFERLAREEDAASSWDGLEALDYPGFGRSTDDYENVVRPFYQVWNGFSTKKTFSWRDEYRSSDAPNRATRRLVEQENKKLRDEGIREFNEAVRTLVAFVRKRDPRYVPNTQTEAERQKAIRDASAAQAARSRAANQAKLAQHIVPDWARSEKTQDDESFSDSSESVVQEIECVVCQKTFKSEKQYEAHEKSKKHAKAVQSLQREMKRDDQRFNLNDIPVSRVGVVKEDSENLALDTEISNPESADKDLGESTVENGQAWETEISMAAEAKADTSLGIENDFLGSDTESELDDDYVQLRTVPSDSGHTSAVLAADATTEKGEISKGPKLGKAKAKRVKKAARQELEDQATGGFQCITCKNDFSSKNKLFAHINALGHAPLASVTSNGKKKRR